MRRLLFLLIHAGIAVGFIFISFCYFNLESIISQTLRLIVQPLWLSIMFICYGLSFACKAMAWKWYLNKHVHISTCLDALFYSLFINHLLPVKVGDAVRAGVILKEKDVTWDEAIHSVLVMRMMDLLILSIIIIMGAFVIGIKISMTIFLLMVFVAVLIGFVLHRFAGKVKVVDLHKHMRIFTDALKGTKGLAIIFLIFLSWLLEAAVIFAVSQAASFHLSALEAVWVNSFTIAGQVFHFTPGGIGSYESMMSFALFGVGFSWENAYTAAVLSHLFKFIFSYIAGIYVLLKMPVRYRDIKGWIRQRGENQAE